MSGVEPQQCCCAENLHPCCVKYEEDLECECCCGGAWCNPPPPEPCAGDFPEACISSPALENPLIAYWTFEDLNQPSNNIPPNVGAGVANLEGTVNGELVEEVTEPIKYWKTVNYPEQFLDSGLSGAKFTVSTVLSEENPTVSGVKFSFKLRVVPGSSSWFRVDYSANGGSSWITAKPPEKIAATFFTANYHWTPQFTVVISNSSVVNNPNLAFRVVSVFSPEPFTEYFTATSFTANQGYESSRNVLGGNQNAPYVHTAPWGFDDVKIEHISIATSSVPPCRTQRFIRSQSGCFATEEECRQHFIEFGPLTQVQFLENVNCNGDAIPTNSTEMPADFCVVPDKQKLCPQWMCGCCGPTVACCTVEDFDTPCPEPPTCNPDDCCNPPPPELCCCVTVVDGCTTNKTCVGFVPGAASGINQCSDFNIITETNQTYCVPVPTCDYCVIDDCNVGILFSCQAPSCPSTQYDCYSPQFCCDRCIGYDPISGDCIVFEEQCRNCFGRCGLGNNTNLCCTAECAESGGYGSCQGWSCPGTECGGPNDCWADPPGAPCNPDLQGNGGYPGGFCFLTCQMSPAPLDTELIAFPMTCEFCKKIPLGLCYTGNCPPWVWGLTMGFEESAAEKDLTKGVVFDKNGQPTLNTAFIFGYGENRL
jgi:hypothetical protein